MNAHNFYLDHKDHPVTPKPLPDYDVIDQAKWILCGNGYQWVELDTIFNVHAWQEDSKFAESQYVSHRDIHIGEGTHVGWESCTLHGIDVDKTNVWQTYGYEKEPEYIWTSLGKKCKNIKNFFKNVFPSESYARIRFMRLAQLGSVSPHNDFSPVIDMENILDAPLPINVAIDHPKDCYMTLKDSGCVPFATGKMFMVNIFKDHSVVNLSRQSRTHLIAHCHLGNRKQDFCEMLVRSYEKQHERISSQI